MLPSPQITVLMPAYNAEAYIAEAIESVLVQTFTDFELLIINDGSTDKTKSIIRSYTDRRIRLYTTENRGVIEALNFGLSLAKGRYIARFDADDVCYAERLMVQFEFLENNPDYVLVGSASDYIDKDGHFLFEWQPGAYESDELQKIIYAESPFDHPAIMYIKDVAVKLGGYPKGAVHFEDHLFWTHFFEYGKLKNLKQPLIKHRFNPESVTVDERWRGIAFQNIKYRSIKQGYVSKEDEEQLKEILKKQDFKKFKDAAYYSMIAKKYLWNQHQPTKARAHLLKAISIMPMRYEPYVLYFLSFFPEKLIKGIYNKLK